MRLNVRVGKIIQNMKKDFIEEEQQRNIGYPQKFWRNLKSVVPGKKKFTGEINLKVDGNKIEPEVVANSLNTFFANIGKDTAEGTGNPWFSEGPNSEEFENIDSVKLIFNSFLKLVKEINTNKTSGLDTISGKILKDALLVLIPQLVYLFNLSLKSGIFPEAWKLATVN